MEREKIERLQLLEAVRRKAMTIGYKLPRKFRRERSRLWNEYRSECDRNEIRWIEERLSKLGHR